MAVKHVGNGQWLCLEADTKPTNATINSKLWVTDSNKLYTYNGTSWRPTYRRSPATVNVYKEDGKYYAAEADGSIISEHATDADVVINAGIANIPGAVARGFGARVFMYAENYDTKAAIVADKSILGYHGVVIEGEGKGTRINIIPTSSLTDGIKMRANYNELRNLMVVGNQHVVNIVKIAGGPNPPGEQYNWVTVENVSINGKNSGIPSGLANTILPGNDPGTGVPYVPIAGQIGLYLRGATEDGASYFTANNKIHNVEIFACDLGCKIYNDNSDMSNHSNVHCGACNIGYKIEGGVQHNLVNFRIEGGGGPLAESTGHIGVWIAKGPGPGGNINMLDNINVELHKANSQGILIDNGVSINKIGWIYNSSQDEMTRHNVVDNNKTPGLSMYQELLAHPVPSQGRRRTGAAHFGLGRRGFEDGILNGNVKYQLDGVDASFTRLAFVSGPFMQLQTASTVNSVASIYYNNADGNVIYNNQYPALYFRFIPNSLTDVRIFMGLWNAFAAPTSSADLLANRRGIGMYLDTSVSNNWRIMQNDNNASSTISNFPSLTIGDVAYGPNAITNAFTQSCTVSFNASNPSANVRHHGLAYDYKTTNIPSGSGTLGILIYVENLTGGAARSLRLFDMEMAVITL